MRFPSEKQVRIVDIARALHVSSAAVSKVLSGADNANIRVGAEKAELIRETARKMNYSPNINARALAGQKTRVIGVLVDSLGPGVTFQLIAQIEKQANLHGYRVLIGEAHDNVENLFENYMIMKRHGVDGVICIAHDYPGENEKVAGYFVNSPDVVFMYGPHVPGHSQVFLDLEDGIADAARLLRRNGRKNIGLLASGREYFSVRQRMEGFLSVLPGAEENIFDILPFFIDHDAVRNEMLRVIREFVVPRKLDAVIAANDVVALMLKTELELAGYSIPDDIALVGHDNDFFTGCCNPPLTTIDECNGELGEKAVSILLALVESELPPPFLKESLEHVKPKLIVRNTTKKEI